MRGSPSSNEADIEMPCGGQRSRYPALIRTVAWGRRDFDMSE
jgi:hypothetical protein